MKKGILLVVSAPSGAGKTTIVREIIKRFPSFRFSVSATTRKRREMEVEGKDYYFLTRDQFEQRIANDDLIEYEEIYSNYYGTLKNEVEHALAGGDNIVFDVDVKGGLSIKRRFPEAVLIFVEPPSLEALRARLENRKSETKEQVENRMKRVSMELEKGREYDYIVINDELKRAVDEVSGIVRSQISK